MVSQVMQEEILEERSAKIYYTSLYLDSYKAVWVTGEKREYSWIAVGRHQELVEDFHVNDITVEVEVQA